MTDQEQPKMDPEQYQKVLKETENYFQKSIHDTLKCSLIGEINLCEEMKEKLISSVKTVLEKDDAKWDVTLDGNRVVMMPVNDAAVDMFYKDEQAKVMKEYLKHWKHLKAMTSKIFRL